MSFKADLKTHLQAAADIAVLVGDRITPGVRAQEAPAPALSYQVLSRDELPNLAGSAGAQEHISVRIECVARSFADVRSLGAAVRERMRTAATTFRAVLTASGGDGYDSVTRIYRRTLDFSCWYG